MSPARKRKGSSKKRKKAQTRRGSRSPRRAATRSTSRWQGVLARIPRPRVRLPSLGLSVSPERKADLGTLLLLVLTLFLLRVLLVQQPAWAAAMGGGLRRALGWGAYLFPLGLGGMALWLLLRRVERVPPPTHGRVWGVTLVGVALLTAFHDLVASGETAWQVAAQGKGGGYVGAVVLRVFAAALGEVGGWLAVLALGLFGLSLALDRPIVDLFVWVGALWERFRDWRDERRLRAWERRPKVSVAPEGPLASEEAAVAQTATTSEAAPSAEGSAAPPTEIVWQLPSVQAMLDEAPSMEVDDAFIAERARLIEETLAHFNAPGKVVEIQRGPTVTLFGVEPGYVAGRNGATRVRVAKIASLADDLALALAAKRVRIQAPVPGKGYIGIEVPNDRPALVTLRQVIESEAFQRLKSPLRIALGQDVAGRAVAADLAAMPHLLIAGATGSGKSVCVNGIITCLLLHNTPEDLRLLLVDPKRVELNDYNGIPHLLAPVVVDLERVVGALQWAAREMERRYKLLAEAGTRHIADYNARQAARGGEKLPYLVIVIDELADLMMLAPEATERTITRLAQLARATGIHLVLATQRPSVDVVTGLIKANFPARIAFAVASSVDSRVILDQPGAERLLGRGDMLFMAPNAPEPIRLQGVYVSDEEIRQVVRYWRTFVEQGLAPASTTGTVDAPLPHVPLKQKPLWEEFEAAKEEEERDPLWDEAIAVLRREGRASVSLLQRRLRIGYTRAARLIEALEAAGVVGPPHPTTGIREVLPESGDPNPDAEKTG
ncbi:MAG TPA: DNA translocase FtsK [Anaerolineae bacterium]|nr:DNA translocase FtsK [Anaerolineae bacterium]